MLAAGILHSARNIVYSLFICHAEDLRSQWIEGIFGVGDEGAHRCRWNGYYVHNHGLNDEKVWFFFGQTFVPIHLEFGFGYTKNLRCIKSNLLRAKASFDIHTLSSTSSWTSDAVCIISEMMATRRCFQSKASNFLSSIAPRFWKSWLKACARVMAITGRIALPWPSK